MVLLLHVLFSRLLLPLFSPPFPSTSSLLSPILLPLFFSFVSFHSVPPAWREQPPEGTELWDPQAGGQPAEEPLGAHLAAGRLGGSVQVHATTRRGHGRAWGKAEPTCARPQGACRPCQAAAPGLRTPGSWPGCDTPAQGCPRVMPGALLPARSRGWRCFPGLPLGLGGQLETGTAPALLRVCAGHGRTPGGDFPSPPSLEWSGGFEPGFSSLSLGSPQPRLPALVPSLRRQPPARRLLPLPRAGRLQSAWFGGGHLHQGPLSPPQPGLCCLLRLCCCPRRRCSFLLLRDGSPQPLGPGLSLSSHREGQGRPWGQLSLPRSSSVPSLPLRLLPAPALPASLPSPPAPGAAGDAGGSRVPGLVSGGCCLKEPRWLGTVAVGRQLCELAKGQMSSWDKQLGDACASPRVLLALQEQQRGFQASPRCLCQPHPCLGDRVFLSALLPVSGQGPWVLAGPSSARAWGPTTRAVSGCLAWQKDDVGQRAASRGRQQPLSCGGVQGTRGHCNRLCSAPRQSSAGWARAPSSCPVWGRWCSWLLQGRAGGGAGRLCHGAGDEAEDQPVPRRMPPH